MIEQSISKRYARALFSLAQDVSKDSVDAFGKQIAAVSEVSKNNASLPLTLANRYFDIAARERIMQSIAAKLEVSEPVTNFLKLLIRKGRIVLLPFICEEYETLANQFNQREVMTVVSAVDLPEEYYIKLKTHFAHITGKQMVLKRKKLAEVLGGVRVHVGEKVYDYTVKNQLEQIKTRLMA